MSINSFQRQGDPVQCGFTIGRAPLALRGIRFAEGEQGGAPAAPTAPAAPAGGETPPVGSPTDVAAMLAALGKTATPPAPAPQPPAQPALQQIQGFTPEQVQKLMGDADTASKAAADAQAALATMQQERDAALAQVAEHARIGAVTSAADGKANASLLLDSAKFQAAIKDLDLADAAKLGAAVEAFVKDNPAYAAAAAPALPPTSGGTPAGGSTTKPTGLEGALAAALGD